MDSLIINGGKKLIGNIPISGSKNACLPMMIASLMTDEKMTLNNIPMLSDVKTLISILKSLGTNIEYKKDNLYLHTKEIINHKASYDLVKKMRASFKNYRDEFNFGMSNGYLLAPPHMPNDS